MSPDPRELFSDWPIVEMSIDEYRQMFAGPHQFADGPGRDECLVHRPPCVRCRVCQQWVPADATTETCRGRR